MPRRTAAMHVPALWRISSCDGSSGMANGVLDGKARPLLLPPLLAAPFLLPPDVLVGAQELARFLVLAVDWLVDILLLPPPTRTLPSVALSEGPSWARDGGRLMTAVRTLTAAGRTADVVAEA